jgi:hypothetical protein
MHLAVRSVGFIRRFERLESIVEGSHREVAPSEWTPIGGK